MRSACTVCVSAESGGVLFEQVESFNSADANERLCVGVFVLKSSLHKAKLPASGLRAGH